MINIAKKTNCSGCYACAEICPRSCITMLSDEEGFWYPKVDEIQCIRCGVCETVCPIAMPSSPILYKPITAYAARHRDDFLRLNSSSGGVFSEIAIYVLKQGGVVFGAGFDENFNVVHKYIESVEELDIFRGSKYVQSRMGNAYKHAEDFLKSGRLVLFSGTPCQIEGLLAYLKKTYENLITQDLICHGVPSPMVWQKYIEYRMAEADEVRPQKIAFRAKNEGWKRYSVSFLFENDQEYRATLDKDSMMQAFLKNLCLRPSCYDCAFKNKHRKSDITLGDFWGVEHILPAMDDDKGVSLVIIHSKKGADILEKVKDSLIYQQTDFEQAIFYNTAIIKSASRPGNRENFMQLVKEQGFRVAQKKYLKNTPKQKIRKLLSKIKRKFFGRK